MLKGKTVLLAVTGGIACYKSAGLASALVKRGANVHVLMTRNATEFIGPHTFESLTGNRVSVDTFDRNYPFQVEHIALADQADAVLVAPATANVLAKLALHVTRLPRVDEELTLVTQPERCKRAVNKRITHFYDANGAEVATMDSRWVLIDTEKRMILRKHPEQFADQWAEDVPLELPMRLPRVAPEDCETLGTQTAAYSRCDMNGHLNNTRYADIVCDAVPWQVWDSAQISDFIISYHREVPRGESFTLRRARPAEDTFYFEGEREGKSAFEAQLIFKHL